MCIFPKNNGKRALIWLEYIKLLILSISSLIELYLIKLLIHPELNSIKIPVLTIHKHLGF